MPGLAAQGRLGRGAPHDGAPPVEVAVGPPVAVLKLLSGHPGGLEHDAARVVPVPVAVDHPPGLDHAVVQARAGIRGQDVERGGLDPLGHRPLHGPVEHARVVLVHPEHEAAVHHHPVLVQAPDHLGVVPVDVLPLALLGEVPGVDGLKAHEQAAQTRLDRLLQQPGPQHRLDGPRGLPQPSHAAHPVEQGPRETGIAEQVVVQEVQMAARQPVDLGERRVHRLGVERLPALEERLLVTKVAHVRAAARDHDRVRHEIAPAVDQVAPDRGQPRERPLGRLVPGGRAPGAQVRQEARPDVLPGPAEDRVRVPGGLVRQRRHMQAAQAHVRPLGAVMVGQFVRPPRGRDVDLDHHQVRLVGQVHLLHVLVGQRHLVVRAEISGQRGEPERREQRVLDRPEERGRGLGQGGQDHLHARPPTMLPRNA